MSRASQAGNAVMKSVEDLCGLYRVPSLRMQSRMFTVAGEGGRERPFFVGEWTDELGVKHRGGMGDLLLQPKITIQSKVKLRGEEVPFNVSFVTPLWVECKSGAGKQTPEQKLFQAWVQSIGASYLLVNDSCDQLMVWFKEHGVRKP
jgi:hypothetical protein